MNSSAGRTLPCLICGQVQPKAAFLAHIAEHLNYRQHKCQDCTFESITAEEMADHEAANPEHMGQLDALRNSYMDRVCRFIYNDCDYGERNGLQRVLKRKFASEDEAGQQHQNMPKPLVGFPTAVQSAMVKAEDCALPSPKVNPGVEAGRLLEQLQPVPVSLDHHQWTQIMGGVHAQQQAPAGSYSISYQHMEEEGGHHSEFDVAAEEANFLEQQANMGTSVMAKLFGHQQGNEQQQLFGQNGTEEPDEEGEEGTEAKKVKKSGKKPKETFENVQCLKCGQWVKGRGICLLYHMNTRHLKLPMFRCRACPRDFFYVTDTTAKNHIRSFHGNDLSLLENNYATLSKILHESRKEFYGESRSEKKAAAGSAKKKKAANKRMLRMKAAAQKEKKAIAFRERPQAGSGGSSSHVQCNQCGEFVATIYSSQLSHINSKHMHLSVYECRICQRVFESLSTSAAVMHVKSTHGKEREEAEQQIIDRRNESLQQLNESYRAFFS